MLCYSRGGIEQTLVRINFLKIEVSMTLQSHIFSIPTLSFELKKALVIEFA
jgi:hypothetical protein